MKYAQTQNMKLSPEHRFRKNRKLMSKSFSKLNPSVTYLSEKIESIPVEWVIPPGKSSDSKPLCIYFHGGAFSMGGFNSHREMVVHLAKAANMPFVMVDYRLAPENPYPAALEDAITVYEFLLAKTNHSMEIFIGGDSAGGNLCLSLLQHLQKKKTQLPNAFFMFSPWLNLKHDFPAIQNVASKDVMLNKILLDDAAQMYAPNIDKGDPRISPIFGELSQLPPSLVIASQSEILIDDSKYLVQKLKENHSSVEFLMWDKVPHAFPVFARLLPEAKQAIKKTGEFLQSRSVKFFVE
jgi:acetyl esterase/lipase